MAALPESDEALMARYARGEAQAFELLYRRHESRVWRYLRRLVGDGAVAEELMQETWFAVARDARRYRAEARFTTWLFTIARNRALNSIRDRRLHVSVHDGGAVMASLEYQIADSAAGPAAVVQARQEAAVLQAALDKLPREQRETFLLHVEGELTVQEVSTITDTPFETVRSRLRYARERLRELLSAAP